MLFGFVVLLSFGLQTELEWVWLSVLILGFLFWVYQAYDPKSKNVIKMKLPVKYSGFDVIPPESHATGTIIWCAMCVCTIIIIWYDVIRPDFKYEMLPVFISVLLVCTRVLSLCGQRGFGVIINTINKLIYKK